MGSNWIALAVLIAATCTACIRGEETAKGELTVFAAASLTESFKELGRQFEEKHPGVKVSFNFGASNQLRTQLQQGANADLFASANTKEMDAAVKSGVIAGGAPRTFARNHLIVLFPNPNRAKFESLKDLSKPGLKLVIAAKAVPVGKYTLEMLDKMSADPAYGAKFKEEVLKNVVSEEDNVKSVVVKVRLDQADAGIAYVSDLGAAASEVGALDIPASFNPIALYPIAPLSKAPQPALAKEFIELLLAPDGQSALQKHGFMPAEDKKKE